MSERIMGAFTCRVCGRTFPLIAEKHYVARANEEVGITSVISKTGPKLYDAFDCPHCGCQNTMGLRLRENNLTTPEQVDGEEEEEED